jgi:hypothetical protein
MHAATFVWGERGFMISLIHNIGRLRRWVGGFITSPRKLWNTSTNIGWRQSRSGRFWEEKSLHLLGFEPWFLDPAARGLATIPAALVPLIYFLQCLYLDKPQHLLFSNSLARYNYANCLFSPLWIPFCTVTSTCTICLRTSVNNRNEIHEGIHHYSVM